MLYLQTVERETLGLLKRLIQDDPFKNFNLAGASG